MACESLGLDPCVALVLRTLGTGIIQSLQASLEVSVKAAQAQILVLEGNLLALDVLAKPLEVAKVAAQKALDEAQAVTQFIPFGLTQDLGCVDLSDYLLVNAAFVDGVFARAETFVNNLDRLNFIRLLIGAGINELNAFVDKANRIIDCIDEVVLL